jgi:hypothetical protein
MGDTFWNIIIQVGFFIGVIGGYLFVCWVLERFRIVRVEPSFPVNFKLPDHLHKVAEMLCDRNYKESGILWTVDELCRRLTCESLRQERDKAPDFRNDHVKLTAEEMQKIMDERDAFLAEQVKNKECAHEWDYGRVMPHKYPEEAMGKRMCRKCQQIDLMKFVPGEGFTGIEENTT